MHQSDSFIASPLTSVARNKPGTPGNRLSTKRRNGPDIDSSTFGMSVARGCIDDHRVHRYLHQYSKKKGGDDSDIASNQGIPLSRKGSVTCATYGFSHAKKLLYSLVCHSLIMKKRPRTVAHHDPSQNLSCLKQLMTHLKRSLQASPFALTSDDRFPSST